MMMFSADYEVMVERISKYCNLSRDKIIIFGTVFGKERTLTGEIYEKRKEIEVLKVFELKEYSCKLGKESCFINLSEKMDQSIVENLIIEKLSGLGYQIPAENMDLFVTFDG